MYGYFRLQHPTFTIQEINLETCMLPIKITIIMESHLPMTVAHFCKQSPTVALELTSLGLAEITEVHLETWKEMYS